MCHAQVGGKKLYKLYEGTIWWNISDDSGKTHEVLIPNSYHVPGTEYRMVHPHHWAQATKDDSTNCTTYHDRAELKCPGTSKKVPLDQHNVFTFRLADSYNSFTAFCTEFDIDEWKNYYDPMSWLLA